MVVLAVVMVLASCGRSGDDDEPPTTSDPPPARVGIALPGDPNGVWWDAATATLVLIDDTNHALIRWSERDGFTTIATLPVSRGLGGVVGLPDGRFVVTALGFGTEGAVYVVDRGTATRVPKLDPERRRLGIARAPDGALYVTYFTRLAKGQRGGVARLDLERGETVVIEDELDKPVGVIATADTLYVTDQRRSELISFRRDDASQRTAVRVRDPDLLAVLPDGDLVTGTRDGMLHRISPGGGQTTLATGFEQVRGVAHDPANKRLFVVEHSVATSRHQLHILAVE